MVISVIDAFKSFILWKITSVNSDKSLINDDRGGGGGRYSLIWAIYVSASPKGMVFQPFW